MRTDKYMMAKAWMKQDPATPSEALDTWNTLEAEFNEERKAMLMASAESDAIKEAMNKKFGSGTVKYGSEISQPPARPDVIQMDAVNAFMKRNPAAEGGRQGFDNGLSAKQKKALTITYPKDATKDLEIKKSNPGADKVFMKSTNDLYEQFGKEVVDAASIQEYGVPFNEYRPADDVKGAKRQNFIRYFKKDMEDYGEYIGTKNPDKDRRTMKRGIRAEREAAIKIKLINKIKDGKKFNVENFLKKNNLTLPELKTQAAQLQRNIYTKRMIATGGKSRATLKWLTDDINTTDKVLETLSKSKLIINKSGSLGNVMFDAFGREFLKGTNTKNPDYNLKKLNAIKKNLNEYNVLNKYLQDTYGINTQLDHPLSQQTIKKLMNGTAEELSRVNILEQNLNNGFKKTLNDRYLNAVNNNNLVQKRAVEKIANDLNFNIGSVPDGQFIDVSKIDRGVGSFETLDIKKEMLKSLKNAANLDSEFTKYIKANPEVLKDAGINVDTLREPKNVKNIANNIDEIEKYIKVIGCPNFKAAGGGRAEFSKGGGCFDKGTKLINSGMKGASPAALKNLAKLGPMLLKAGSAAMSGVIVPEALIIGLESAARVTMGDTPSEAILRATDYLTPDSFFGDFMQKADLMKIERTLGKDVKNIAAQSFDRINQSDEIKKLEEKLKNLEAMTESGDFGYIGDLTNQINITKNQIKEKKDKLKNTAQIGQESRDFYTQQALDNAYDASMAKSKFSEKRLVDSQSENPRLSAEQAMQDMKSQEQLNKGLSIRSPLTGSKNETAFLNLSQLPTGPRMPSEIDMLAANVNKKLKDSGSDLKVTSQDLKFNQDRKKMFKDASIEKLVNMGLPLEAILGFNIAQPVERTGPGYMTKYKPLNRFGSQERPVLYPNNRGTLAEGGITGLRSKYEYKK
jgi:hypothetical protein